jgi:hypothetical protein
MDTIHEICKGVLLSLVAIGLAAFLLRPIARRWLAKQDQRSAAAMVSVRRVLVWVGGYLFGSAWITDALVTGQTSLKRVSVTRAGEPFLFWFIVGVAAFIMTMVPLVLLVERKKGPAVAAPSPPGAAEPPVVRPGGQGRHGPS